MWKIAMLHPFFFCLPAFTYVSTNQLAALDVFSIVSPVKQNDGFLRLPWGRRAALYQKRVPVPWIFQLRKIVRYGFVSSDGVKNLSYLGYPWLESYSYGWKIARNGEESSPKSCQESPTNCPCFHAYSRDEDLVILYGWHLWDVLSFHVFCVVFFWISILQLMALKQILYHRFFFTNGGTDVSQCKTWTPSTSEHRTFLSSYEGGGPQPRRFMEIRCLRKISICLEPGGWTPKSSTGLLTRRVQHISWDS